MHRLDQGSAGAGLGCNGGGDIGSGLKWGRRHCWDRARALGHASGLSKGRAQGKGYTREAAGAEAGHGKGVEGAEAKGRGWALEGM